MALLSSPPPAEQATQAENPLRQETAFLAAMLDQTIETLAGSESLQLVGEIRRLAQDWRSAPFESDSELSALIAGLDHDQLRIAIRAFTVFLDLVNLAEDRQRVRVLREREQSAHPEARGESVRSAILQLERAGISRERAQNLIENLNVDLVFTSHPTEAKRRSVRRKLRRLRELLSLLESEQLPAERHRTQRLIRAELAKLWQTDFIRPWRPSVMQEVERGLSFKPVLWDVVPSLIKDVRASLDEAFAGDVSLSRSCLRFGSWIGGDRDGHPGVTPEITEQTVGWLRNAALEMQVAACGELFESLSLSRRQLDFGPELHSGIYAASEHWPQLKVELAGIPPNEICRRWLRVIHWRLRQTQRVSLGQWKIEGAYSSPSELSRDVSTLLDAVRQVPAADLLAEEVQTWLDRVDAFGFHLAALDVRQDARKYRLVMDELLRAAGLCPAPQDLTESKRQALLLDTLHSRVEIPARGLSQEARETTELFGLLHRIHRVFGSQALGGHVISMTHAPSDVLTVLWLWHQTSRDSLIVDGERVAPLPIIPLFETIDDLQRGPEVLDAMLQLPAYREYVRRQGDRLTIMLGYSDSTKDGGYLSACWSLYQAQQKLLAQAARHGVQLTFFHGRGGSLGRGGGPAARSILSLPAGTFAGSLRLTEQGEVLADRYDDPRIAYRHLEQLVWSSLLASGLPADTENARWVAIMQQMSDAAVAAYRDLVDQPGFVDFFREATAISEIEQLPIGSRPSRRQAGGSLQDLRAIPWVFSWTQCRCLIPAWYGLGTAIEAVSQTAESREQLEAMYREWPFFRGTIDNAELAMAKADLDVAEQYARLGDASATGARIKDLVAAEFRRTRDALLSITGHEQLLDGIPWLQESIRVRNRFIDPLNLIQVNLLGRLRDCPPDDEEQLVELRHLTRLTIAGVAAGMRTSG